MKSKHKKGLVLAVIIGGILGLVYLGWIVLWPELWPEDTPPRAKQKAIVSLDETAATLDAIQALRQLTSDFVSKIKEYVSEGDPDLKKAIDTFRQNISEREKTYHTLSQSPEKLERYQSVKFFRERLEKMGLAAMDSADAQRMAIETFDKVFLKFMTRISEARQLGEWRVQMAQRRSNISSESSLKTEFNDTLPILNTLTDMQKWMSEVKSALDSYRLRGNIEKRAEFRTAVKRLNVQFKKYEPLVKSDEEIVLLNKIKYLKNRLRERGSIILENQDTINRFLEIVTQTQRDLAMVLSTAHAQEGVLSKEIEIAAFRSERREKNMMILILLSIFIGIIGLAILLVRIVARPSLSYRDVQLFRATNKEILSLEAELMKLRKQLETGEETQPSRAVTGRETILIVDKDAKYAQELSEQFKDLDYRVFRAFDDKQAIIEVLKLRPDLIVADAQTAISDHYELLKKYKANQETIPIVMIRNAIVDTEDLRWSPLEFASVVDKDDLSAVVKASVKELNQYREQKHLEQVGQRDKHILIVHKDVAFAQMFSEAFKLWKYPVTVVNSCMDAVKPLQSQPVKLLLLDYPAPGMDGDDFVEKVKILSPTTAIITMADRSEAKDVNTLKKLGAFVSIWKPFDLDEIREVVDNFFMYDRKTFTRWFNKASLAYEAAKDEAANKKKVA